jgi:tetratricopeptide (TPR) repeat protein
MPKPLRPNIAPARSRLSGRVKLAVFCVALALVLSWSQGAVASEYRNIPEEDFKYLPEYCKLAVRVYGAYGGATPEQLAPLSSFTHRMGCQGGHYHHYCAGLWHLHRASLLKAGRPLDQQLEWAASEFDYMLGNCKNPNAPIMPEILTNQGRAFVGLKKYSDAVRVFTEAIRSNPKYVAAYVELSGVFVLLNSTGDARKILEDGLKHSPGSKVLKARLDRLGRKDETPSDLAAPEQQPKPQKAKP